jgi:hypothetical protein
LGTVADEVGVTSHTDIPNVSAEIPIGKGRSPLYVVELLCGCVSPGMLIGKRITKAVLILTHLIGILVSEELVERKTALPRVQAIATLAHDIS